MAELQIVGPPGTGKTTTLARLVERGVEEYGDGAVVVTSLTKAAASEIASRGLRIPREHAGTLHSLCYRRIGAPPLVYKKIKDWNNENSAYRMEGEDSSPDHDTEAQRPNPKTKGDELRQTYDLLRHRMLPSELMPAHVKPFATAWEGFKRATGTIDFTDMISMALDDVPTAPGAPDAILADEVQDYSRLETALLRKWGAQARTLVLAGDADQAIYEWRGADPAVFVEHDVGDRRRVLTQSYRVPRAVHAVASAWVKRIRNRIDAEYLPRDEDGEVRADSFVRWKYPESFLPKLERWHAAGESVIVAATCDYMLAPTLAVLRREGLPFSNPWRRANGAWNPLAQRRGATAMADRLLAFLRPDVAVWAAEARMWDAEDLRAWTSVLRAEGVLRRGAKAEIDRLGTAAGVEVDIGELHRWFEPDAFDRAMDTDIDWWVRSMLAARQQAARFPVAVLKRRGVNGLAAEPVIHAGTIHSFKGAEADHVVLFPDLSPAGARQWQGAEADRDAVRRLVYVGMTRARQTLTLAGPSSPLAVSW